MQLLADKMAKVQQIKVRMVMMMMMTTNTTIKMMMMMRPSR